MRGINIYIRRRDVESMLYGKLNARTLANVVFSVYVVPMLIDGQFRFIARRV